MDVNQVAGAMTERTKAVIPVHLFGHPADLDPLLALARRRGVAVIEDAAQAHGAEYRGRRVGGLGDLGCFSFYPTKNLGAYGEGGIVVTSDEAHARAIRALRSWGGDERRPPPHPGFNYRMDALQGTILRVKLRHLPAWTEARRRIAAAYDRALAPTMVAAPAAAPDVRHAYHCYAIETPHRDALRRAFEVEGIRTGLHYPTPIHLQPCCGRPRRTGRRPCPRRSGSGPQPDSAHVPRAAGRGALVGGRGRPAGLRRIGTRAASRARRPARKPSREPSSPAMRSRRWASSR